MYCPRICIRLGAKGRADEDRIVSRTETHCCILCGSLGKKLGSLITLHSTHRILQIPIICSLDEEEESRAPVWRYDGWSVTSPTHRVWQHVRSAPGIRINSQSSHSYVTQKKDQRGFPSKIKCRMHHHIVPLFVIAMHVEPWREASKCMDHSCHHANIIIPRSLKKQDRN